MLNIAVLVSGGGTNLQAIIDAKAAGRFPNGHLALVLSSHRDAYALKRAEAAGIPTAIVRKRDFPSREAFDDAILNTLVQHRIDVIVTAGFLYVLGDETIRRYPNRIINVHPSLIPSFCGKGFFGLKVHEAALSYGVKVTGATVHYVNEVCDGGEILLQKAVNVLPGDSPESLQKRVMEEAEWQLLPEALEILTRRIQ